MPNDQPDAISAARGAASMLVRAIPGASEAFIRYSPDESIVTVCGRAFGREWYTSCRVGHHVDRAEVERALTGMKAHAERLIAEAAKSSKEPHDH